MNQKKRSLVAGLLYLSLVVFGPIALLIIPAQFDVDNMNVFAKDHLWLIGIWIVVDLIIIGIEVILSIALYKLFESYNQKLSLAASIFRFAVVLVMVINVAFLSLALINQGNGADVWIHGHQKGVYVWQLFFSVHVFLLGIMVFKSNVTYWRYLGIALLLGSFGYLIDAFRALTQIDHSILASLSSVLLIFITISEIGMAIGLIMNKVIKPTT